MNGLGRSILNGHGRSLQNARGKSLLIGRGRSWVVVCLAKQKGTTMTIYKIVDGVCLARQKGTTKITYNIVDSGPRYWDVQLLIARTLRWLPFTTHTGLLLGPVPGQLGLCTTGGLVGARDSKSDVGNVIFLYIIVPCGCVADSR